jgi:hypothetical protein
MADSLVSAIRHPAEMRQQAQRGREVVLARYDWSRLADELERAWIDLARGAGRSA